MTVGNSCTDGLCIYADINHPDVEYNTIAGVVDGFAVVPEKGSVLFPQQYTVDFKAQVLDRKAKGQCDLAFVFCTAGKQVANFIRDCRQSQDKIIFIGCFVPPGLQPVVRDAEILAIHLQRPGHHGRWHIAVMVQPCWKRFCCIIGATRFHVEIPLVHCDTDAPFQFDFLQIKLLLYAGV